MHYKNGREAKAGDRAIDLDTGITGFLHSLEPGSMSCNARLAQIPAQSLYVTIGHCLHLDDVEKAVVPDSTKETK